MEFSDLIAQLRRRWWLVLVGLVGTGALAYGVTFVVAVQYTAQSSLVLLPPRTTADAPANPFLAIGGLNPAADVLVRSLNTGTFHDEHAPAGGTTKYTVSRDTDASGPLLVVDASAPTPEAAMGLLEAVVQEAPARLAQLQADVGVQDSVAIRITEVARVAAPTRDTKSQTRAIVAIAVVGLALTVLLVRVVDNLLARRARRRLRSRDVERTNRTPVPEQLSPGAIPAVPSDANAQAARR